MSKCTLLCSHTFTNKNSSIMSVVSIAMHGSVAMETEVNRAISINGTVCFSCVSIWSNTDTFCMMSLFLSMTQSAFLLLYISWGDTARLVILSLSNEPVYNNAISRHYTWHGIDKAAQTKLFLHNYSFFCSLCIMTIKVSTNWFQVFSKLETCLKVSQLVRALRSWTS